MPLRSHARFAVDVEQSRICRIHRHGEAPEAIREAFAERLEVRFLARPYPVERGMLFVAG